MILPTFGRIRFFFSRRSDPVNRISQCCSIGITNRKQKATDVKRNFNPFLCSYSHCALSFFVYFKVRLPGLWFCPKVHTVVCIHILYMSAAISLKFVPALVISNGSQFVLYTVAKLLYFLCFWFRVVSFVVAASLCWVHLPVSSLCSVNLFNRIMFMITFNYTLPN
jgi:hypothetical protein